MIWCYITVLLIHIILLGKYFVRGYVKSSMGPTVKVDLSEYQRLVQEWKQRSSRMQIQCYLSPDNNTFIFEICCGLDSKYLPFLIHYNDLHKPLSR